MHLRGETAVKRQAQTAPVTYMIFDLLWLDGHSLIDAALQRAPRAARGARARRPSAGACPSRSPARARRCSRRRASSGLEGVIGKRLDSRYVSGRAAAPGPRSRTRTRQEVVIGGWTTGKGARAGSIGALLLGVHDDDGAAPLRRARRHRLRRARARATLGRCSSRWRARRRRSPGASRRRASHFVEPELVCEVEFSEWTHAGTLRQPSYKGLRDDKRADEVVRERVESLELAATRPLASRLLTAPRDRAAARMSAAWIAGGRKVRGGVEIEVEGRTLKLTNLDKVLYPEIGFTKADLIGYYAGVAPVLLPHLHDRPLTLKRYPDGVERRVLLREALAAAPPRLGADGDGPERPRRQGRSTTRSARTCRRSSGSRTSPTSSCIRRSRWRRTLARPTMVAFDLDPGAPGEHRRVLRGRARAARAVRAARARGVREDLRLEGPAGLRAAQPSGRRLRADQAVRARRRGAARGAPPEAGRLEHGQGQAPRARC